MDNPFKSNPREQIPFVRREYNPEKEREWIRGAMTLSAMLIFAVTIGGYLLASVKVSDATQWSHVREATEVILPTVTSVLGSALGFYFGSQKK